MGVGLDIGTTQLFTVALSMSVAVRASSAQPNSVSDMAAAQAAIQSAMAAPSVFILLSLVGLLCSSAGGYLTAYLAKTRQLLNTAVMGLSSASIALLILGASGRDALGIAGFALAVATIPAAMLGGQLARMVARRAAASSRQS